MAASIVTLAGAPGQLFAGPEWEGGMTLVHQHSDDSRVSSETTLSADFMATWNVARGSWLLFVEGSSTPRSGGVTEYYPSANADAGSVMEKDGTGGIQISEFNYTFNLGTDQTLMLGLLDPTGWLDRGRIANDENQDFVNGSFVNNATIEFPDYTVGGVFRRWGDDARPEIVLVLSGSDGIADLPDRSYQDLLDLDSAERGIFIGAGASWLRDRWSWRLGAWARTDDNQVAGSADPDESNFGAYAVMEWLHEGHAIIVRLGAANTDAAIADRFAALAYELETRVGQFGIGVARTDRSDDGHSYDVEAFLRVPLFADSVHLTPSLQYLRNSAVDTSDSNVASSTWIAGLRFNWSF